MVFTTAGGGATQETDYEISNSLRFNDGDSPALQFTPSSDSNEQTWTVSFWVKRSTLTTSSSQMIFCSDTNYSEYVFCRFCGTEVTGKEDMFQVFMVEPNTREGNVRTNRLFRDVSAWYHIVVRCDLTQSTAADRLRIYVNGVKETSFDTASYLNQNDDNINWNSNVPQAIGHQKQAGTIERFFDGYISEFYNIDGTSLGPDSFGETNDNGVWIPKKYTGSYGTNGYKLEFKQTGTSANSSGIGADTSGNDNHYTPTNLAATDVTTDTPTNNFCTWNPLANYYAGSTFSEGNCYITMADSVSTFNAGTFGLTSGKWYWETKVINIGSGSDNFLVGAVSRADSGGTTDYLGEPTSVVYRNNGNIKKDSANATHGASYGVNDIVMVALDCDNDNIYFGSNGNWANGSGSNNQSSPSSAVVFTNTMINDGIVFPAQGDLHGNTPNPIASTNFGNPPHSISSGNSDANGYGNFEYAVPSGYYALCTKNLAEYG